MRGDPCFSCLLPDCDDRDHRCNVRELANTCDAKRRRGSADLITEAEREASNRLFHIWNLERQAEASEGGRPHRRGSTVFQARQASERAP